MGIFKRLGDILKANINDLLSKAEDPEKMLNQMVFEMEEKYAEAKKQVMVAVADEKRLHNQYEKAKKQAFAWADKAKAAMDSGREDLAQEALLRKTQFADTARGFKEQWEKQKQATESLKSSLRQLQRKIGECKSQKQLLIARAKRAEAQKKIHETMAGINDSGAFATFERMEERVDQLEAEGEAAVDMAELEADTLEREFEELDKVGVDEQLKRLKEGDATSDLEDL
ncbi:PspA/IM30 family protein [bacterium]|nr:PspA/IM30 family protein [bacterium]